MQAGSRCRKLPSSSPRLQAGTTGWRERHTTRPSPAPCPRRLEGPTDAPRLDVLDVLDALPGRIGLLTPRTLVPVMAKLSESVRLNHLGAEAVALAILVDASLLVVASSAILESACARFGIALRVAPV